MSSRSAGSKAGKGEEGVGSTGCVKEDDVKEGVSRDLGEAIDGPLGTGVY